MHLSNSYTSGSSSQRLLHSIPSTGGQKELSLGHKGIWQGKQKTLTSSVESGPSEEARISTHCCLTPKPGSCH